MRRKTTEIKPKSFAHGLRPRNYAASICALGTPEERREALAKVPELWQGMTKAHVEDWFARRRAGIKKNGS